MSAHPCLVSCLSLKPLKWTLSSDGSMARGGRNASLGNRAQGSQCWNGHLSGLWAQIPLCLSHLSSGRRRQRNWRRLSPSAIRKTRTKHWEARAPRDTGRRRLGIQRGHVTSAPAQVRPHAVPASWEADRNRGNLWTKPNAQLFKRTWNVTAMPHNTLSHTRLYTVDRNAGFCSMEGSRRSTNDMGQLRPGMSNEVTETPLQYSDRVCCM